MQQNDVTKAWARARRRALPAADGRLWDALRNRRFLGLKVRRQVPLAGHVVDFYLADQRLAISLDPLSEARAESLAAQGFRVLRLERSALAGDLAASLSRIAAALHGPSAD